MLAFSIFRQFFLLGCICFGGPSAHIGYFRNTFVEKRHWLDDKEYAQLVALSQLIPGPGSSQVGFALGYRRGGIIGALAAFMGFTLPSVVLVLILAQLSNSLTESSMFQSIIHCFKLLAVVVVADAILGMADNFCRRRLTTGIAVVTATVLLIFPGLWSQALVLIAAAILGFFLLGTKQQPCTFEGKAVNRLPLVLFTLLLFGLPLIAHNNSVLQLFSDFFQTGSLVFGGGHVVLPLLQNIVGNQLSSDTFLTGYAAAQAVPGPMFTLATYLGYQLLPLTPLIGALVATVGIFLPGFLLLLCVMKNWQALATLPFLNGALNGVNAAVVGLLLAALYQPVFISAVTNGIDASLVIIGFFLLRSLKLPIIGLVALFIITGIIIAML